MKKIIFASILISAAATVSAGDVIESDSAAINQGIREGTQVRMEGEIVQSLGDERYLLRDRKGQIEIELDDKLTADRPLKSGTQVSFTGEVEHDDGRSVVEVDKIHSIKGAVGTSSTSIISN